MMDWTGAEENHLEFNTGLGAEVLIVRGARAGPGDEVIEAETLNHESPDVSEAGTPAGARTARL